MFTHTRWLLNTLKISINMTTLSNYDYLTLYVCFNMVFKLEIFICFYSVCITYNYLFIRMRTGCVNNIVKPRTFVVCYIFTESGAMRVWTSEPSLWVILFLVYAGEV